MSYPNPYAKQWAQFRASTPSHELTVLHDDGLYRHLRMAKPGTSIWSWNVVTWPGYLNISGDIGQGFTFVRESDMLAFFDTTRYGDYHGDGSPHLQADYWAEKLTSACRAEAWSFNPAKVLARIREELAERGLSGEELSERMADATASAETEHELRSWLCEDYALSGCDTWEWSYQSLDHHYLLACYAITTTARAYRAPSVEAQP